MSQRYEYVDKASVDHDSKARYIAVNGASVYVPTDPAELHKLTEAIHGREIAAIAYVDELPEVKPDSDGDVWVAGNFYTEKDAAYLRDLLPKVVAAARHIEARDAAAKAKADEDAERVERLAKVLHDTDPESECKGWSDGCGQRQKYVDRASALAKAGVQVPEVTA